MIQDDLVINFKDASVEQKRTIKSILTLNYIKMLDSFIEEQADYVSVTSSWKNHVPISMKILSADEFIQKYKHIL